MTIAFGNDQFGNEWQMAGLGGVEICVSNSPIGGIDVLVDGKWKARYLDTEATWNVPNDFWDYNTHLTVTP